MSKVFTVRLSKEQVEELTTLATYDGVAIAEEIREAITLLKKSRSQDPHFARRVQSVYQNARKTLAELERGPEILGALSDATADVEERPSAPQSLPAMASESLANAESVAAVAERATQTPKDEREGDERKTAAVARPAAAAISRGKMVSAPTLVGTPVRTVEPMAVARARTKRR